MPRGKECDYRRRREGHEENCEWVSAEITLDAVRCVPGEVERRRQAENDRGSEPEGPLEMNPERRDSGKDEWIAPPVGKEHFGIRLVRGVLGKKRQQMRDQHSENAHGEEHRVGHRGPFRIRHDEPSGPAQRTRRTRWGRSSCWLTLRQEG